MYPEAYTFSTPSRNIKTQETDGILKTKNIRYAASKRYQLPVPVSLAEALTSVPDLTPVCPQHISPMLERMIEPTLIENFLVEESPQYLSVTFQKMCYPMKNSL